MFTSLMSTSNQRKILNLCCFNWSGTCVTCLSLSYSPLHSRVFSSQNYDEAVSVWLFRFLQLRWVWYSWETWAIHLSYCWVHHDEQWRAELKHICWVKWRKSIHNHHRRCQWKEKENSAWVKPNDHTMSNCLLRNKLLLLWEWETCSQVLMNIQQAVIKGRSSEVDTQKECTRSCRITRLSSHNQHWTIAPWVNLFCFKSFLIHLTKHFVLVSAVSSWSHLILWAFSKLQHCRQHFEKTKVWQQRSNPFQKVKI